MTAIRHLSRVLASALFVLIGVVLMAEATGMAGGHWRRRVADTVEWLVDPGGAQWQLAVSALVLIGIGLVVLVAQVIPPSRGLRVIHEVRSAGQGRTLVSGRVIVKAAEHEVCAVEGVRSARGRFRRNRLTLTVEVDDAANVVRLAEQVRKGLSQEFWVAMGVLGSEVEGKGRREPPVTLVVEYWSPSSGTNPRVV